MKFRYAFGLAAFLTVSVGVLVPVETATAKPCVDRDKCLGITYKQKANAPRYTWSNTSRKWVKTGVSSRSGTAKVRSQQARRGGSPKVLPAARQQVVALIKQMAPSYGVPTWFALRIAQVESGYNPRARGAAGEYGVFQMKCSTARGIGFRGSCSGLLNSATNVRIGLKHLQLAVRSSRGNLKLAASKHNGGLGRKSLVRKYVNLVF
jgi:soluble lytic murein transglycosylase-like protein